MVHLFVVSVLDNRVSQIIKKLGQRIVVPKNQYEKIYVPLWFDLLTTSCFSPGSSCGESIELLQFSVVRLREKEHSFAPYWQTWRNREGFQKINAL